MYRGQGSQIKRKTIPEPRSNNGKRNDPLLTSVMLGAEIESNCLWTVDTCLMYSDLKVQTGTRVQDHLEI